MPYRKGDYIDMLMDNAAKNGKYRDIVEMECFSDYPETVQTVLKFFLYFWRIPEQAIPRKAKGGAFAQWILELQILEKICSSDIESIMKDTYDAYLRLNFPVSHPGAIKNVMIDVLARRNQAKARKSFSDLVIPGEEKTSSGDLRGIVDSIKTTLENNGDDLQ